MSFFISFTFFYQLSRLEHVYQNILKVNLVYFQVQFTFV